MKTAPQKQRRNERERNRVNQVNVGFTKLRDRVPRFSGNVSKKMSKVETLREAVRYIQYLQCLLQNDAQTAGGFMQPSTSGAVDPMCAPQQMPSTSFYSTTPDHMMSPYYSTPTFKSEVSPSSSSYYSDNSFDEQQRFFPVSAPQQQWPNQSIKNE